ncbi:AT-rich interactive domain-containing protein 5B isoform X3 [Narcine bancroftii]|uniref:AT-rich interactive domain-containing protein 5B isoform X3 n=1 Tax=Narcine bancroftii TaxID=1343680 RepID=UPI003830FDF5
METDSIKWVGSPCGLHGAYIFYKAFKFSLEGRPRILSLGDFFFVRCKPGAPICIAELQLLWEERNNKQLLSSSKLYFLPEDTPEGRSIGHGEDEVVAVSEKVVVKLDDLMKWTSSDFSTWTRGLGAVSLKPSKRKELRINGQKETLHHYRHCTLNSGLSFKDVLKEKADLAPNLKGRPRKKKPYSQKRDGLALNGWRDSNEDSDGKSNPKSKCDPKTTMAKPKNNNSNCKNIAADEKSKVVAVAECKAEEQAFLVTLYKYMKERNTPIERIPYLGFKQINLWTMFQAAQNLGGYEAITARRQWKQIYDELGGNPGSTSAATCTRRHYERLILPYERYIKGEEDKPLPPVKPRKQENSSQEAESKMKAAGTKRKSEQNRKVKKEKDATQKMKDYSEATSAPEGAQEVDVPGEVVGSVPEGVVTREDGEVEDVAQGSDGTAGQSTDSFGKATVEQSDGREAEEPYSHCSQASCAGEAATSTQSPEEGEPHSVNTDDTASNLNHQSLQHPPDLLENGPREETATKVVPSQKCPERDADLSAQADQRLKEEAESRPGSGVQRRQPGRANPHPLPCPHKDKEEMSATTKHDTCPSYMPMVYSRGHPGIMSPLAKKKFLSQVSGTLPNNYSIGAPPPLISKKMNDSADEMVTAESNILQGSSSDQLALNRPSVIQRAHSFQKRGTDERGDAFKHDGLNKSSDSESTYLSNHHLDCSDTFKGASPYPYTSDLLDSESSERKGCQPSQVSSFLADFYSSPHLHSLYKHAEHHLNSDQTSKYLSNVTKDKSSLFMQHKNQDAGYLNYLSTVHQPEKKFGVKLPTDEQPTDLSLPKLKKMLPKNLASTSLPSPLQPDVKSTTAGTQPANPDCNPKACRVPPMPVAANPKPSEVVSPPAPKLEEAVRPTMGSKSAPQVIGTTKPIKRRRESADSGSSESPEKKLRAVSPISKDLVMKEKTSDLEGEGSKTLPPGIFLEGHKFPLPTPIFPGVYPGAFVSQVQDMCDGLSSHFPVDYAHPLQYLKNQAVLSPLMQPLAIHSFMIPAMQRQILASTSASPHLYRHLSAAATPVAASYGDILHHSLYPLASLNPQVAYSTSPISSLHPSTKL